MVTLKQYSDLEDKAELDFALKYSQTWNEPIDQIGIGELNKQTFGTVKEIQYKMDKGFSFNDALFYFDKFGVKNIHSIELYKLCQSFNYLLSEINRINEIETQLLSSQSKGDEIEAGIESLSELGIYLQVRQIAITFGVLPSVVEAMPYDEAFLELVTQKRLKDYEQSYWNIRNKK